VLADRAVINPHNFRESLLAYTGLIRSRNDAWAVTAARDLVTAMARTVQPDGTLDLTALASWGKVPPPTDPAMALGPTTPGAWCDMTGSTGRAIEALVWLYEETWDPAALALAQRIAKHHLAYTTHPDGRMREEIVDPANPGHCHSYHGTLRGLLLLGLRTDNGAMVDVVEKTYRRAVRNRMVTESGWAPHDLGTHRFDNEYGDPVADAACPGDSAQLALWLALRAGCDDLLDDVERLVRCRLLPAQLTPADVAAHPEVDVDPQAVGAWTNHGPSHAGKRRCLPDVHAAVVHTLCDVYTNICTVTDDGVRINLHLDCETAGVRVASARAERGHVSVKVAEPQDLSIRVPGWAPADSLCVTVDDDTYTPMRDGVFMHVPASALRQASEVVLSYDLPERETEERMESGRVYRFRWRGDEIVGVSPQDGVFPFYPGL
jgi:hypothetical protein